MNKARKEQIRQQLKQLESKHGRLTPEAVVREAKKPSSILHDEFEWDDKVAAQAHRIEQARGLIQTVFYSVTETNEAKAAPYYVRDPSCAPNEQGYRSLTSLKDNREEAAAVLNAELLRIESLLTRLEVIAEVLGMRNRVENVTRDVRKLRDSMGIAKD